MIKNLTKDSLGYAVDKMKLASLADSAAEFLTKEQLTDTVLWKKFVNQFREQLDGTNLGWRGEYWGKMLRAAVTVYEYNRNETLYGVMTDTVKDMLTVIEDDGRVSSFSRDTEFNAWDMWCRKYVILAMMYYYDVCRDEKLRNDIVEFCSRVLDYIIIHIGNGEGQKKITKATSAWLGLNSSSILEPVVRLYKLSGKKEHLDFANYIVEEGGADGVNIFKLALEDEQLPYRYGVSKAYEMISCFEGVIELYRITGIEDYKTLCVNFAKAVAKSDVSIIGSCGCTHELFDHSTVRQTAYYEGIMQETCVTVTWMKFCSQILRITGDTFFADQIEKSFFNAYLGALNTQHKKCAYINEKAKRSDLLDVYLPFDSYSPLRASRRGRKVGGLQFFSDTSYYGCCTCIGAIGVGIYAKHALLSFDGGLALMFFDKGEYSCLGGKAKVKVDTQFPADGIVKISVESEEKLLFKVRIPAWSKKTISNVGIIKGAFLEVEVDGKTNIELDLDMSVYCQLPITWEKDVIYTSSTSTTPGVYNAGPIEVLHDPEDDKFISLFRGPITLCADSRTGKDAGSVFSFKEENGQFVYSDCTDKKIADDDCLVKLEFVDEKGEKFYLVDYQSAGRDWQSDIAAWLKTK